MLLHAWPAASDFCLHANGLTSPAHRIRSVLAGYCLNKKVMVNQEYVVADERFVTIKDEQQKVSRTRSLARVRLAAVPLAAF